MSLLTMNTPSKYLRANQAFSVVLPDLPRDAEPDEFYRRATELPVVWLRHGTHHSQLSGNMGRLLSDLLGAVA